MAPILELVRDYGTFVYLLLFAYCALKSGSLPVFAGYAAQAGALDVVVVALATFAGGYLGDEARFAVARRYGEGWQRKSPRFRSLMASGQRLMERYGSAYIFLYRYPKGMRTIGALPIGLGQMDWPKFTVQNAASAAFWTGTLVGVGYLFGAQVERAVEAGWGAASVALLVAFALVVAIAWWRLNRSLGPARASDERLAQPQG